MVNNAVSFGKLALGYVKDKAGGSVSSVVFGNAIGIGGTLFDAYTYKQAHKKADIAEVALYTGMNYLLWTHFSSVMLAWTFKDIAGMAGRAAVSTYLKTPRAIGSRPGGIIGNGFLDNAAKATMRQRAVQAIQESRMRANYALGSEARRISRGYFDAF